MVQHQRAVVVHFPMAVELVQIPLPFISQLGLVVEQLPLAMHLVVLPVSIVEAAVLIEELAAPISHAVLLVTLIAAAHFVTLHNILQLLLYGYLTLRHLRDCGVVAVWVRAPSVGCGVLLPFWFGGIVRTLLGWLRSEVLRLQIFVGGSHYLQHLWFCRLYTAGWVRRRASKRVRRISRYGLYIGFGNS